MEQEASVTNTSIAVPSQDGTDENNNNNNDHSDLNHDDEMAQHKYAMRIRREIIDHSQPEFRTVSKCIRNATEIMEDCLWLGPAVAADNEAWLKRMGITHILNCAGPSARGSVEGRQWLELDAEDSDDYDLLTWHYLDARRFLCDALFSSPQSNIYSVPKPSSFQEKEHHLNEKQVGNVDQEEQKETSDDKKEKAQSSLKDDNVHKTFEETTKTKTTATTPRTRTEENKQQEQEEEELNQNKPKAKVLVHCEAGVNRSATIVVAFLVAELKWDVYDAVAFVHKKRPVILSNRHFLEELVQFSAGNLDLYEEDT